MKQEDKDFLVLDLCARLPYGVKMVYKEPEYGIISTHTLSNLEVWNCELKDALVVCDRGHHKYSLGESLLGDSCLPYLRPMSSMTDNEKMKYVTLTNLNTDEFGVPYREITLEALDWLNKNHFDYRRLIEKGLALEAPDGMYNII